MINKNKNPTFSIKYYFNYFVENFKKSLKSLLEYKANLYNTLFMDFIEIPLLFFFGYVLISEFGSLINWTLNDFLLFIFIGDVSYLIASLFSIDKRLNLAIINGNLNIYLVRPGNIFLKYLLDIKFNPISFLITKIPFLIYFLYVSQIEFIFLIYLLLMMVFITIFFITIFSFNESCSFIALNSRQVLADNFFDMQSLLKTMTPNFFEKSILKYFLYIIPTYFVGTLIIPLSKNIVPIDFWLDFFTILSLMIIFSILTFLNWRYGLKKYNAYG